MIILLSIVILFERTADGTQMLLLLLGTACKVYRSRHLLQGSFLRRLLRSVPILVTCRARSQESSGSAIRSLDAFKALRCPMIEMLTDIETN